MKKIAYIFGFILGTVYISLQWFFKLSKYIFLSEINRKEFFLSFFSDSIAFVLISIGGFAFVLLFMINWIAFILLILFLALFTTFRCFDKQRKSEL